MLKKPANHRYIINDVYDNTTSRLRVDAELEVSDIQIGAVEIKNSTTDDRANINSDGTLDVNFPRVDVQHPLPTDGDSVYAKDIDVAKSDLGTFNSSITDLFDDYSSSVSDSTTNVPKILKIYFKRPIESGEIGFGSLTGNFSNVKILLKDLAGNIIDTIGDGTDDTKYTSKVYSFNPTVFIEAEIQFHTADPVELTGAWIPTIVHNSSQLKALKPDGTETYIDATAGGNLKVAVEEFDETFLDNPLPITKGFNIPVYDDISITYVASGNGVGEIETVTYKYQTVVVATLTLTYDANNKLIGVVRT